MQKKIKKKRFVLETNAFDQTFHETKKYFSNSITFTVINQYVKGAGIKIESGFRPIYHAACRGVLSNGSFYAFSKHVFPWR